MLREQARLSPTHGYVEISTILGGLIYLYWYYNNSWFSLVYLYWYYKFTGTCTGTRNLVNFSLVTSLGMVRDQAKLSSTHGYVEISTILGGLVYLYWYYNNSWLSLVYLYWYDKTAGLVSSTCTGTTTTAGTCTCTGTVVNFSLVYLYWYYNNRWLSLVYL